jgi:hypothetical protein
VIAAMAFKLEISFWQREEPQSTRHFRKKNITIALSGTLTTGIGFARSLYHLYLEGNDFNGTLPTELGLVTTLEELRTYLGGGANNELTGTIPSELGLCTKLSHLHIGGAQRPINIFGADCLEPGEEMVCSCCTFCCDSTSHCQDSL